MNAEVRQHRVRWAAATAVVVMSAGCGPGAAPAPVSVANEAAADAPAPAAAVRAVGVIEVRTFGGKVIDTSGAVFEGHEPARGAEVDVVDCGGWIGRARLIRPDADPVGWRIEWVAESRDPILPDVPCRRGASAWTALVVLPADPARADRRTAPGDPHAAYATLPAPTRAWHEADGVTDPPLAQWADLDGDRAIDLVDVEGRCKPGDDYVCGTILHARGGAWIQVGRRTPL